MSKFGRAQRTIDHGRGLAIAQDAEGLEANIERIKAEVQALVKSGKLAPEEGKARLRSFGLSA